MDSPDFFSTLETIADKDTVYALDLSLSFHDYPPTAEAYKTVDAQSASPGRLQYMEVYMDGLLSAAQWDLTQKQRSYPPFQTR